MLPAILTLTGCGGTSQYYDSHQQPAATQTGTPHQTSYNSLPPADDLSYAQPDSTSPNSQSLVLHEGDVVKISLPGSPNLDANQQIRLDGKIALSLVGDVQAAGLTPAELQQNLIKLYAPQISTSEINVEVESSSFPIFVTGCVLRPGKVLSNQPITALEAVMEAGGFDYARANLKSIHVIRRNSTSSQSYVLNLRTVLDGDEKDDFFLQPDDIIYVPEKFSWF
ncbi:MAG TPA: polysaccharide biosynthesis/export family protein [Verrucomicrobiae bacterium]